MCLACDTWRGGNSAPRTCLGGRGDSTLPRVLRVHTRPPHQPSPLRLLMEVLAAVTPRPGPTTPLCACVRWASLLGPEFFSAQPTPARSGRRMSNRLTAESLIACSLVAAPRGREARSGIATAQRTCAAHSGGFICAHHLPRGPPPLPRKRSRGGGPEWKRSFPRRTAHY